MRILLNHFKKKKKKNPIIDQQLPSSQQLVSSQRVSLPLTWRWAVPTPNRPCSCRRNSSMNQVFVLPLALSESYKRYCFPVSAWRFIKNKFNSFRPLPGEHHSRPGAKRPRIPGAVSLWNCYGGEGFIKTNIPINVRPIAPSSRTTWCFWAAD